MSDPESSDAGPNAGTAQTDGDQARVPMLPWCRDCWDQAGEGTKQERDGLPETCQHCDSGAVFWI